VYVKLKKIGVAINKGPNLGVSHRKPGRKDIQYEGDIFLVRFEVFTAVTMKNGVFWDVTPCGSCKN
jgi:hypothetical protein